jgi:hypothetical protein
MLGPIKLSLVATVTPATGETFTRTVIGRDAWALLSLLLAGPRGCTPIQRPAPRWSHYVFKLRRAGINVETIHEGHEGSFAGTHARYLLRDLVSVHGGTLDAYLDSVEGRREFPGAHFGRAAA